MRKNSPERPIIFIAHSLGGLLVEQALITTNHNIKHTPILDKTYGLVFFSTPHEGGNRTLVGMGKAAVKVARDLGMEPSQDLVETLERGSIFQIIEHGWRDIIEGFKFVSFWEADEKVVEKHRAEFRLLGHRENIVKLDADHRGMCKFDGRSLKDQDNFKPVLGKIDEFYNEALRLCESTTRPVSSQPESMAHHPAQSRAPQAIEWTVA
ncbi:hypothetical protein B0H63DRAFT_291271 [Podospora didyma]|uniref:DUF676 domain-containing protein n=1 Tax=Podospora didyma TaxID=330526 RepID=A0AAE0K9Y2_9PEZI|nr:hypothetical protein B0H63DRAFT_291271 [Podospora didyma]